MIRHQVATGPPLLNGRFLSGYDRERARPSTAGCRLTTFTGRATWMLQSSTIDVGPVETRGDAETPSMVGEPRSLLPFHFLRDGDRLGRAVVKLQRGDGAVGTGFLVAPDVLLTNHHVLPDAGAASTARALANYEERPREGATGRAAVARLDPHSLFVTNAELDFTFCGVSGLEDLGTVPLERDSLVGWRAESVNIIQHPRGRPKEVALRDNRVVDADNLVIQYVCDTEPGSSGSPVFDNRWTLVALHHASVNAVDEGSNSFPNADRILNEGVRLSAIAAWLETADAEAMAGMAAVARLREAFRGPDPQIGFFGGLGRRGLGRTAAETVIELYRGGPGDLDLGFWDLGEPGRPALHRRAEVASVLAEMGVDLWCLTHVEWADARGLLDELHAIGRAEYRLLIGQGETPVCFLYRCAADLTVQSLPPPGVAGEAVRIGTTAANGQPYRLHFLPLAGVDRPTESFLQALRDRSQSRGTAESLAALSHDWLLIGGFDARGLTEHERRADDSLAGELLLAAGPDHALALVTAPNSSVDRVFATRNVMPLGEGARRLTVVRDRPLPAAAREACVKPPMALRLSLHRPTVEVLDAGAARPVTSGPARPDVEAQILVALRPLIARLLDEATGRS